MSDRLTNIVDEEIEEFESCARDEVFLKLSSAFLEEKRLIKRFYDFCDECNDFEYDETGENMDEPIEILRKINKIRDKFLGNIEEKYLFIFDNVETNTLARIITADLDTKEHKYKLILEIMSDSFNLEIL